MKPREFKVWLEKVRSGRIHPTEIGAVRRALLASPDQKRIWEEELALNRLLEDLRPTPLPSNFTAMVVHQAQQTWQDRAPLWQRLDLLTGWSSSRGLRLAGITSLALVLSLATYRNHQQSNRQEMAQNVAEFTEMVDLPSVEALENFEVIHMLGSLPPDADIDLLTALQ